MDPPPTVNDNPTVLEVSTHPSHQKRHALEWPELAAISADPFSTNTSCFPLESEEQVMFSRHRARPKRSSDDLAVTLALSDASIASGGKAVSLLRNFGLKYPVDEAQRQDLSQRVGPTWKFSAVAAPAKLQQGTQQSPAPTTGQDSKEKDEDEENEERDIIDEDEVFDIIRNIQDPEHPLTLEQLGVVSRKQISVCDRTVEGSCTYSTLDVRFTPTIPHCSMATQIGLCLTVKLNRSLPRFKTTVRIEPGAHASEKAINKQLADKERVCAALENKHLVAIVDKCIIDGMTGDMH